MEVPQFVAALSSVSNLCRRALPGMVVTLLPASLRHAQTARPATAAHVCPCNLLTGSCRFPGLRTRRRLPVPTRISWVAPHVGAAVSSRSAAERHLIAEKASWIRAHLARPLGACWEGISGSPRSWPHTSTPAGDRRRHAMARQRRTGIIA